MDAQQKKKISKQLSYVLRHAPESINLNLGFSGWVSVDELLDQFAKHGKPISREHLNEVVGTNDKQRFEFDDQQQQIRARQGHSTAVDLQYEPTQPPDILYQGTATRFLESIFEKGLIKGARHHVHLSVNKKTLLQVGSRHGKPAVLAIDAKSMTEQGYEFFVTGNQVWLTEHVPPRFISEIDPSEIDG